MFSQAEKRLSLQDGNCPRSHFFSICLWEKMQTKRIPVSETLNLFYSWGLVEGDSDYISLKIFIIAFSKYGLKHGRSQKSPGSKWTWHLDLLSWQSGDSQWPLHSAVLSVVLSCFKTWKSCLSPIPQTWVSCVKITVVVVWYSLLRNASPPQILNNKLWVVNKPKMQNQVGKHTRERNVLALLFLSINAQGLWSLNRLIYASVLSSATWQLHVAFFCCWYDKNTNKLKALGGVSICACYWQWNIHCSLL